MSARGVRSAVIAELEKVLPGAVFKPRAVPVPAPSKYAVVWAVVSDRPRTRYGSGQSGEVVTITVHCVGADDDMALWVQERVDSLTGRVLAVPGRRCHPVEFITAQPPDLNDEAPTPLLFAMSQFDVTTDPA